MNERSEYIVRAAQNEAVWHLGKAIDQGSVQEQQAAWEVVYRFVQPGLLTVAEGIVKRKEVAEEIVQEALTRAAEHFDKFDRKKDFFSWLASITERLAIDHTRRSETKNASSDQLREEVGFDPVARGSSPEDDVAEQMSWNVVAGYLDQLAPNQRKVIELELREELHQPEIAKRLDMTSEQVNMLRYRAKQKLKMLLENDQHLLAAK